MHKEQQTISNQRSIVDKITVLLEEEEYPIIYQGREHCARVRANLSTPAGNFFMIMKGTNKRKIPPRGVILYILFS